MDDAHRLDTLRIEGAAAVRAAEGRLSTPVPHLEWTVGEVLEHLGGVHRRFARCLRGEVETWPDPSSVVGPADGLAGWAQDSLAEVVAALRAADLDTDYVTWAGSRDGHWVLRRLANETTLHRWDIEAAAGPPAELAPELGLDVVDEFLTVIVDDRGLAGVDDAASRDGTTLHLHATDHDDGEWFVTVTGCGLDVAHRHEKGDVALRGPASHLALWISGRFPASRLEAFGDPVLVDWWDRAFRFD